jgi:uncharacterized ParB-like nuclease family protein
MDVIKFSDHKEAILKALKEKKDFLKINEPLTLMEGFINQPICKELTGSFIVGGATIPMIVVVGNQSGKVYFFALKALLPELGI